MSCACRRIEVGELDTGQLAQIEQIYVASFPLSERAPFSALADDIRRGYATLYVAVEGETVLGFGVTLALPIEDTAYLGYLATDLRRRGEGVGGRLFRAILEEPAARGSSTALMWEVERPEPDAPPEDPKWRRIAFYERNGGVLLDRVGDFQMPDLTPREPGYEQGMVPALLMWASAAPRSSLTRVETLALVAAVYRVGYGRDLTDPLVRYVLSTVAQDEASRG